MRIVASLIAELFPDSGVHLEHPGTVVRAELGKAADGNYNEESAIQWGLSRPTFVREI